MSPDGKLYLNYVHIYTIKIKYCNSLFYCFYHDISETPFALALSSSFYIDRNGVPFDNDIL